MFLLQCTGFDIFSSSYFCWAILKKAKQAVARVLIASTYMLYSFIVSCYWKDMFSCLIFANTKEYEKLYKGGHISQIH